MPTVEAPYLIDFPALGDASIGYLSVADLAGELPFVARRVFWTWATPTSVTRGRHAHLTTEVVLVAVSGAIHVATESAGGDTVEFRLDSPARGLYLPPRCWRTMSYSPSAVQLAFASTPYSADDYIRSYEAFRALGDS